MRRTCEELFRNCYLSIFARYMIHTSKRNDCEFSQDQIQQLTFVKTILMLLVILYHSCVFWTKTWITDIDVKYDSVVLACFSRWLNSFHVYAFAMISGCLFTYLRIEKNKYKRFAPFIISKIKRLLIPFVFVLAIWVIPIGQLFFHYNIQNIVSKFILATAPGQLWFLLMLFWCFVAAWVLKRIIDRSVAFSIVVAFLSYIIGVIGVRFLPDYFCVWTEYGALLEPLASVTIEPLKSVRQSHKNREILCQNGRRITGAHVLF